MGTGSVLSRSVPTGTGACEASPRSRYSLPRLFPFSRVPCRHRSIKLACGLRNDGRMGESQLSELRNMRVLLEED